jgi:hypothetical protein
MDTTAAMAGAISGARLGLAAVLQTLAHRLTDRGTWSLGELIGLADDCHKTKQRLAQHPSTHLSEGAREPLPQDRRPPPGC